MVQEILMDNLQRVQKEIHYEFKQVKLLIQALSHTSYANEQGCLHNERLEFLGDAVLELAISHILFTKFPQAQEGQLTRMRSALVSETALAAAARRIDLGTCLLLGKGEDTQGGREKNSVLSDALEAVLGAVYLDGGLEDARECVNFLYKGQWPVPPENFQARDFKSQLQELTQRLWKARPVYALLESSGPEHAKEYMVQVVLPDKSTVQWMDKSMRKAEQGAAEKALDLLQVKYPPGIDDMDARSF